MLDEGNGERVRCDILVIGSGIAGLSFALEASRFADVVIVSKRAADEAHTKYAQGGISAVLSPDDSFDLHVQDTLVAGAGLCREDAVRAIVEGGPARIQALRTIGVSFDLRHDTGTVDEAGNLENAALDLTRE